MVEGVLSGHARLDELQDDAVLDSQLIEGFASELQRLISTSGARQAPKTAYPVKCVRDVVTAYVLFDRKILQLSV